MLSVKALVATGSEKGTVFLLLVAVGQASAGRAEIDVFAFVPCTRAREKMHTLLCRKHPQV